MPENDTVVIARQRFIAGTMWFRPDPTAEPNKRFMHDFSLIQDFEPWVYEQNAAFEKVLATHVEADDVVVTHHLPAFESVPARFARSAMNAFFVCDMTSHVREHQPIWRLPLPSLQGMTLDIDPEPRTWRVRAPHGAATRVFSGVVGKDRVDEETWSPEPVAQDERSRATVRGGSDLIVRSVGRPPLSPEHEGWDAPMPEHNRGWNTEIWFSDDAGRAVLPAAKSRLRVTCEPPPTGRATFVCVAHDTWESYVWLFGRSGSTVTQAPVLTVDGRILVYVGPDGTLLAKTYEDLQWVDPSRRLGVRFPYPRRPDHLYGGPEIAALGSGRIAIADHTRGTVSVFALP